MEATENCLKLLEVNFKFTSLVGKLCWLILMIGLMALIFLTFITIAAQSTWLESELSCSLEAISQNCCLYYFPIYILISNKPLVTCAYFFT